MTRRRRDEFPLFLREYIRPVLRDRGYRFTGQTATVTRGPATAHLCFMRYTSSAAGKFDVRMSVTLDDYYMKELGVVAGADLSIRTFGSVAAAPWRWPTAPAQWPALAESLVPAVVDGANWLESLLDLRVLAAHLEAQRRFSPDVDRESAALLGRMQAAGIQTLYQSPGFGAPRAGKVRPDKVKALSYCYELLSDWHLALEAWNDYLGTFEKAPEDHVARRRYLEQKCGAVQQADAADEAR